MIIMYERLSFRAVKEILPQHNNTTYYVLPARVGRDSGVAFERVIITEVQ